MATKTVGTGKNGKVALSGRLQAALVAKAGLSEDKIDHIWEEVNKEAENYMAPTLGRRYIG